MFIETIQILNFFLKLKSVIRLHFNIVFIGIVVISSILKISALQPITTGNSKNFKQNDIKSYVILTNENNNNHFNDIILTNIVEQEIETDNDTNDQNNEHSDDQLALHFFKIKNVLISHFRISISQIVEKLNNSYKIPLFILFHSWKIYTN
jgi:hypothetical protein